MSVRGAAFDIGGVLVESPREQAWCETLARLMTGAWSGFPPGKPHSESFLTTAGEPGVPPDEAVVVEDADSGVQAALASGMASVGIARLDDGDQPRRARADVVVSSPEDIDRARVRAGELAAGRP